MENYVLIVNWNGWKDTIECLESVLRLRGVECRIIVCDNGSEDGSLDRIREWAAGNLLAKSSNPSLSSLISPPVPKPIPYREFSREEAERGPDLGGERIVLIHAGANLSYAGGNNLGLRCALRDPAARFVWILNNDTLVEPCALSAMIEFMKDRPNVGMCGSLNLAYYNPHEVQAQGGRRYSRWTGRTLLKTCSIRDLDSRAEAMDYVLGCSMLVSREFVEQIGLIEESYFIYFEELDWAERAKGKFRLGYAPKSIIYHKEGASIGTSSNRKSRSLTAESYHAKNRVAFAKRYYPWTLPTVLLTLFATAVHRFGSGNPECAKAIMCWAFKGLLMDRGNTVYNLAVSPDGVPRVK